MSLTRRSTFLLSVLVLVASTAALAWIPGPVSADTVTDQQNSHLTVEQDLEPAAAIEVVDSDNSTSGNSGSVLNASQYPNATTDGTQLGSEPEYFVRRTVTIATGTSVEGDELDQLNATTLDQYKQTLVLKLPESNIDRLEALAWVHDVSRPARSVPAVVSEGATITGAEALHTAGITGSGVDVGILSCEGFDVSETEIGTSVEAAQSYHENGLDNDSVNSHGTAVAAVVADVAPAADLHVVNHDSFPTNYQRAVDWLASQNVDLIAYSCGQWFQPDDGTGPYSERLDRAAENGIASFVAAGNSADNHYQAQFTDPDNDGFHNVDGEVETNPINDRGDDTGTEYEIEAGDRVLVELQWDEWPETSTDINIGIYQPRTQEFVQLSNAQPENVQDGDDRPVDVIEFVASEPGDYEVVILSEEAFNQVVEVELLGDRYTLERSVARGSVGAPATGDFVAGITAFKWDSGERPTYSSADPADDGDRTILVSAPTHVNAGIYQRQSGFTGTSAAAPHAAGVAALLLGANASLGVGDLYRALASGADDVPPAGYDIYAGAGHLNATGAAEAAGVDAPSTESIEATGTMIEPDGTPAANDTVAAFSASGFTTTATDDDGAFTASAIEGDGYAQLQYYQLYYEEGIPDIPRQFPRDGVPDIYAIGNITESTDLGQIVLPQPHVLQVQVTDPSGTAIEGAKITISVENNGEQAGYTTFSDSEGRLNLVGDHPPGVEVAGDVTVRVDSSVVDGYTNETINRSLTLDEDRSITVQLTRADAAAAAINFENQTSTGEQVTVESVSMSNGGFVGIHDTSLLDGATFESLVGVSSYQSPGSHDSVAIQLDTPFAESQQLIAIPYKDTNANEVFEFGQTTGTTDEPYVTADGNSVVTDAAHVRVPTRDEIEVSLQPSQASVRPGETVAIDVVVSGITAGVGSYDFVVNSSDPSSATIAGVSNEIGGTSRLTTTGDGSGARLATFNANTVDSGSTTIATITVEGASPGIVELPLRVSSVSDEEGSQYFIGAVSLGTVSVTETAPDVNGNGAAARDPDNDGRYEDVNGDGSTTPGDATVLFNALFGNNPAVTDNVELFDFNDDGELAPGDATTLFQEIF